MRQCLRFSSLVTHSQGDFPRLQRTFFESVSDPSIVVWRARGGFQFTGEGDRGGRGEIYLVALVVCGRTALSTSNRNAAFVHRGCRLEGHLVGKYDGIEAWCGGACKDCMHWTFLAIAFRSLVRACSVTCKIEFAVIDHVWQVAKHLSLSSGIQSETKILRTLSSHWLPYDQHTS